MARSTLTYALALAGLLAVTPVQAAGTYIGQETVADFVTLSDNAQFWFLRGTVEAITTLYTVQCSTNIVGGLTTPHLQKLLLAEAKLSRISLSENFTNAVIKTLVGAGCTRNDVKPAADVKDLS